MKTIVVANRKGGVGKTTVAVAVAAGLARAGRTLLIDLDSQGNATEGLGIALQAGVFAWLGGEGAQGPQVVSRGPGLDVLPGNAATERVNLILASEGDVGALDRVLRRLGEQYQYVVVDCPPSMSMLTRAAVYAADWVLCPTVPEYLSVAGVRQLIEQVGQIRERWQRPVRLMGILPNMYDRRTTEHREQLASLVKKFGAWGRKGYVWPPLRSAIDVARASGQGVPVGEVVSGQVAQEWAQMVERVREVCDGA